MALKPHRDSLLHYDTTRTLGDVASPGHVVCYNVAGSGEAMGDDAGSVQLANDPSGLTPAGMLLAPFVDIDETRQQRNYHKDEHVLEDYAPLALKGWLVTDLIIGSPTVGQVAYLTVTGHLTPTISADGGTAATPKVGKFSSIKDEDGFARVELNLPWLA